MNIINELFPSAEASLPSLPSVAAEIIQLANDPESDTRAIARAVSMDPALATKVLRFVNSPMYAKEREVESLHQAIIILGLNATISLALSFSLVESMSKQQGSGIDYGLFWRRSLVAATSAKVLGTVVGEMAIEELFLAALLQDIGILALDRSQPDFYADIADVQNSHDGIIAYEQSRLDGHDHAELGAALLKEWGLPARTALSVLGSHDHQQVTEKQLPSRFVKCVALSGAIADLFLSEEDGAACESIYQQGEALLDLDQDTMDQLLSHIAELIPDIESMFNMSIVPGRNPHDILEQARETLVRRNLEAMRLVSELQGTTDSLKTQAKELEEHNRRDALTGVFNRGYLDQYLEECFDRALEQNTPLSLAFVDLDHFKQVNDQHGHQIGDDVLKVAAELLQTNLRKDDIVARYGGEEFVLVMRDTTLEEATSICERTLHAFRQKTHSGKNENTFTVTCSIGLATHGQPQKFHNTKELIAAADSCVYISKQNGRDRLQVCG